MRVYLPATLSAAAAWHSAGAVPPSVRAFAVTPGLREWYSDGDDEELEWAATTLAGREALRLLASDPDGARRRVVVAADVADADVAVTDAEDRGSVRVGGPVPVARWAAVLLDEEEAAPVITAAAAAIVLADGGDEDAAFEVSEADDAELLWYAVEEFGQLPSEEGP